MILHDGAIESLCSKNINGEYRYQETKPFGNGLDNVSEITSIIHGNNKPMIEPFVNFLKRTDDNGKPMISYGLSSMGYDVRLSDKVKIFTNANARVIDPIEHDEAAFIKGIVRRDEEGRKYFVLPPNSYALGHTLETFSIPREIIVIVLGKSTYARSSIIINTTPIEPGFEGQVVIELANACSSPVKVYLDGGIAQFVFARGLKPCAISYADRDGKYQNQRGLEHAKA
jgi:dCTP deaminase